MTADGRERFTREEEDTRRVSHEVIAKHARIVNSARR